MNNSLAEVHPELITEWSEKNLPLTPDDITFGSNKKVWWKSYCAVLLEGAVIVLACIIFSVFASSPPVVNPDAAAVTQVWAYIGELVFNMLVLVGAVKMSDRIIREMMGL